MIGKDDGFLHSGNKKGGRANPKFKDHKETAMPIPAADAKKKKKQTTFMYGNMAVDQEETKEAE